MFFHARNGVVAEEVDCFYGFWTAFHAFGRRLVASGTFEILTRGLGYW
jgi:hypothetical protein